MSITNNPIYLLNEKASEIDLLEALKQKINNIHVLAAVAATEDFINFDENIIQDYFWIINSFSIEIKTLLEQFSNKYFTF